MAVEIGCGTGCAGLVFAKAVEATHDGCQSGASSRVTITDGDEQAVKFAMRNVTVNGLQPLVCVSRAAWGDMSRSAALALFGTGTSAQLVFAADVVYDEKQFWALVSTLHMGHCCPWP
mmetsp:Transcript_22218/g.61654  ORF Transcript_22218/g.61654 Transcript_22218/m.61654 type:complete len:118 (-) Transcript_22218:521-874(-)